jgi:hypothetical protein
LEVQEIRRRQALYIAFALAIVLLFAVGAPATVISGNETRFAVFPMNVLRQTVPIGLLFAAAFLASFWLFGQRTIGFVVTHTLAWMAIYLIIGFQFGLFISDQPLDGRRLVWEVRPMIIETAVFLLGNVIFLSIPGKLRSLLMLFTCLFVVVNIVAAFPAVWPTLRIKADAANSVVDNPHAYFFKSTPAGLPRMDSYSKSKNVIVILIDTLQSDVSEELIQGNATVRQSLDGFTFFRDATGGYPFTTLSIPYVFSAKLYEHGENIINFLRASQALRIDHVLAKAGFETSFLSLFDRSEYAFGSGYADRTAAAALGNLTLYRQLPTVVKLGFFDPNTDFVGEKQNVGDGNDINSDVTVLSKMTAEAKANADKPQFKFVHLWGSHLPSRIDPDCKPISPGIDRSLVIGQATCVFHHLGKYFDILKQQGVYDNSQIFIIADHGTSQLPISEDYSETAVPWNVRSSAHPTILFKDLESTGDLQFSDRPVSLADLRPTILAEAGIDPDSRHNLISGEATPVRRYIYFPKPADAAQETLRMRLFEVSGNVRDPSAWREITP